MIKYRPHRGGLAEAMMEYREFPNRDLLEQHLRKRFADMPWKDAEISIEPYVLAPDDRIGWSESWIIRMGDAGVVGFTDGA